MMVPLLAFPSPACPCVTGVRRSETYPRQTRAGDTGNSQLGQRLCSRASLCTSPGVTLAGNFPWYNLSTGGGGWPTGGWTGQGGGPTGRALIGYLKNIDC